MLTCCFTPYLIKHITKLAICYKMNTKHISVSFCLLNICLYLSDYSQRSGENLNLSGQVKTIFKYKVTFMSGYVSRRKVGIVSSLSFSNMLCLVSNVSCQKDIFAFLIFVHKVLFWVQFFLSNNKMFIRWLRLLNTEYIKSTQGRTLLLNKEHLKPLTQNSYTSRHVAIFKYSFISFAYIV